MTGPDVYREDMEWALPGACSKRKDLSHERIIRFSDDDCRQRCSICFLPFHQLVVNEWKEECEKSRKSPNLSSPPNPPNPPPLHQPATFSGLGSTIIHTHRPGSNTKSHYIQPQINSTTGRKVGYGLATPNDSLLSNTEAAAAGVLGGHNDARRKNARHKASRETHFRRSDAMAKLRIKSFSCQYYVDGVGEEMTLVPTYATKIWQTDVTVPYLEPSRLLHDWLVNDVVRKFNPGERELCRQAKDMKFVSRVTLSRSNKVTLSQLEDYEEMEISHLLDPRTNPWKILENVTTYTLFTAYMVIYRDRIEPPPQRHNINDLLLPSHPLISTQGTVAQNGDPDDDPFLDDLEFPPPRSDSDPYFAPSSPPDRSRRTTPPGQGEGPSQARSQVHNETEMAEPTARTSISPTRVSIDLTSGDDDLLDIMVVAEKERWFSPSRKLKRSKQSGTTIPTQRAEQAVGPDENLPTTASTMSTGGIPVLHGHQTTVKRAIQTGRPSVSSLNEEPGESTRNIIAAVDEERSDSFSQNPGSPIASRESNPRTESSSINEESHLSIDVGAGPVTAPNLRNRDRLNKVLTDKSLMPPPTHLPRQRNTLTRKRKATQPLVKSVKPTGRSSRLADVDGGSNNGLQGSQDQLAPQPIQEASSSKYNTRRRASSLEPGHYRRLARGGPL